MDSFGQRLCQLRKEKGISQEALAEELGVTRQAVQKWEAGNSQPSMDNVIAISQFFHVSLDELLLGSSPSMETPDNRAGFPSRPYFEYKSKTTLFGLPLVHINLGWMRWGMGIRRAKGILAVGNVATGVLAFGAVSAGILSIGPISAGLLFSLGAVAASLGVSLGALAVGTLAFGAVALGALYGVGAVAVGNVAAGSVAFGHTAAIGTVAKAPLSITLRNSGPLLNGAAATAEQIRTALQNAAPRMPDILIDLLSSFLQL